MTIDFDKCPSLADALKNLPHYETISKEKLDRLNKCAEALGQWLDDHRNHPCYDDLDFAWQILANDCDEFSSANLIDRRKSHLARSINDPEANKILAGFYKTYGI